MTCTPHDPRARGTAVFSLAALLLVGQPPRVSMAAALDALLPGTRIRVTTDPGQARRVGTLVAVDPDSLIIRTPDIPAGETPILRSTITLVEVSQGRRGRFGQALACARYGFATGALAGAVLGYMSAREEGWDSPPLQDGSPPGLAAVFVGTLVGTMNAFYGAGVGAVIPPRERWTPAWPPPRKAPEPRGWGPPPAGPPGKLGLTHHGGVLDQGTHLGFSAYAGHAYGFDGSLGGRIAFSAGSQAEFDAHHGGPARTRLRQDGDSFGWGWRVLLLREREGWPALTFESSESEESWGRRSVVGDRSLWQTHAADPEAELAVGDITDRFTYRRKQSSRRLTVSRHVGDLVWHLSLRRDENRIRPDYRYHFATIDSSGWSDQWQRDAARDAVVMRGWAPVVGVEMRRHDIAVLFADVARERIWDVRLKGVDELVAIDADSFVTTARTVAVAGVRFGSDLPLSIDLGLRYHSRGAERIAIGAVFSSPQQRALQTVAPFCRSAGVEPQPRDGLLEARFNRDWLEDFNGTVRRYWEDLDYRLPDCDSHRVTQQRFVGELLRLATDYPGQTIACCSGGQAISLALHSIDRDFSFEDWAAMKMPDLFRLSYEVDRLRWDETFAFENG